MAGFSEFQDFPYVFLVIPLAGMGIGALAIWTEHQRKQKSLDVLRAYAERGEEPPAAVIKSLALVTSVGLPEAMNDGSSETGWRKVILLCGLGLGFGGMALWTHTWADKSGSWPFTMGFGITAFVLAAVGLSRLPQALTGPRKNGG